MTVRSLAVVMIVLCAASVSAVAPPAAHASRACHVPRLTGLTLDGARQRATHAGCKLRIKGAALTQASIQTIERQSPSAGRPSSRVTVWLNPLCNGGAAYGPRIKEPLVTPGPAELVSGFFLVGGPLRRFSYPHCQRPEPPPGAGTIEVMNASRAVVVTKTSAQGHFVKIRLPAGSYTIRGTFLGATVNGVHPKQTESIVIPAGHTVRRDFFLSIR
jgi:hypothetical protein